MIHPKNFLTCNRERIFVEAIFSVSTSRTFLKLNFKSIKNFAERKNIFFNLKNHSKVGCKFMSENFMVFKLKNSQFMKTFRRIGGQKPLFLPSKTPALSDGLIFSIDNQIACDLFHKSFSLTARVVGLDFIFRGLGLCKCYGYQALKMLIGHPFIFNAVKRLNLRCCV